MSYWEFEYVSLMRYHYRWKSKDWKPYRPTHKSSRLTQLPQFKRNQTLMTQEFSPIPCKILLLYSFLVTKLGHFLVYTAWCCQGNERRMCPDYIMILNICTLLTSQATKTLRYENNWRATFLKVIFCCSLTFSLYRNYSFCCFLRKDMFE